jgi:hypothetical protein
MNIHTITHAVSVSISKADCLDSLGLEHTNHNYRMLNDTIKKNGINTSHFKGIKASEYIALYVKGVDNQI